MRHAGPYENPVVVVVLVLAGLLCWAPLRLSKN